VQRLRRDPAAVRHWLLVAVLAGLLVALVGHALARADQTRRRWGSTTVVWIAAHPLRRGDDLAGALRREQWPAALVPDAAITEPSTGRAATALDAGVVVTSAMVERQTTLRRTVAVPLPDAHLPVVEGDRVDVWATAEPGATVDQGEATRRVATDARVVDASRGSVVLEIAPSQVPSVTEAAAAATVALVGVP
jgi:Flp pilus assembly protein CpaB